MSTAANISFVASEEEFEIVQVDSGESYKCKVCEKEFESTLDMREHKCKCERCEKVFTRSKNFGKHVGVRKRVNDTPLEHKTKKQKESVRSKNKHFEAIPPPLPEEPNTPQYRDQIIDRLDMDAAYQEEYKNN